jgi:multidrug efflux pump subunit AcrA (membrane-fusion protein)
VSAPQIRGAQLGSMVLTEVVPDGATVKAGDVLARFDAQTQTKDYLEKRDKYTELSAQLAQKRADEAVAKAKDDTTIQEADSAFKNAELDQKNHAAAADLGDALVSRRRDQYQENITQLVSLEVTNSVHQLEQAETSLAAARVSVDLARKSLAAEQRKYDLGSQTAFFVLDAQTQLAQAEFLLSQAKTNYQLSLTALDHATGELIAHHHLTLKP